MSSYNSESLQPGPTEITFALSQVISFMEERLMTNPSLLQEKPSKEWPPLLILIGNLFFIPYATACATSSVLVHTIIAAGNLLILLLNPALRSSYCASLFL